MALAAGLLTGLELGLWLPVRTLERVGLKGLAARVPYAEGAHRDLRYKLRRELIEFARRRLVYQGRLAQRDFIEYDSLLNPDALTIGFARRFATYKRAPLIFQQFDNIVKLTKDRKRPVQFIFAGKAHPRDDEGKRFIQHIIHLSKFSELKGHLVFVENYDVHVARQMVSGCDIWLNNPRRPLEASGTSGQKAGCHGCLNLSGENAEWFFNFSQPGDIVEVVGTGGPGLTLHQGGDWSVPYAVWRKGSALGV